MAAYGYPPVSIPPTVWRSICPTPWKDSFESMFHARSVADQIVTRQRRSKMRVRPQKAYQCRCGSAHLTGRKMGY